MGNMLDTPITTKESEVCISSTGLRCGVSAMQGYRTEMEDYHILMDMPSSKDNLIAAVFDGHGGKKTAEYAAKNLVRIIEETKHWKKYLKTKTVSDLSEALVESFLKIDTDMKLDKDVRESMVHCGSTAVVAIITPTHIVCSNAGDSRCVLGIDSSSKNMSEDHKPTSELELNRIKAAGGFVAIGRVEGDLAVSRGFGDFHFKERGDLPQEEQMVTCNPDITVHVRTAKDESLVVACDGLWDVYSSEEVANLARVIFAEGETEESLVAEEFLDTALLRGSKDNISTIVVRLPGASVGPASGGGVLKRRELREESLKLRYQEKLSAYEGYDSSSK